jgi:iron complex transport system ATP-binding protein
MDRQNEHSVLKTENLCIGYRNRSSDQVVARGLYLSLHPGKLVCLVGRNGIGKSTLLRTLSKMQTPLEGEILLEGTPLKEISPNELAKRISLVLTERVPLSNLTVEELIALGRQPYTNWIGKLRREDIGRIRLAMEQSELEELSHKRCDELSDGQLQRAMICRALAQDTKIIILDEPTAHLDIQHKVETFKLLGKIARQLDRSILISTHEVQLAAQIADELWLMTDDGIRCDTPENILNDNGLNRLFDTNSVEFDKQTMQFIVK